MTAPAQETPLPSVDLPMSAGQAINLAHNLLDAAYADVVRRGTDASNAIARDLGAATTALGRIDTAHDIDTAAGTLRGIALYGSKHLTDRNGRITRALGRVGFHRQPF